MTNADLTLEYKHIIEANIMNSFFFLGFFALGLYQGTVHSHWVTCPSKSDANGSNS